MTSSKPGPLNPTWNDEVAALFSKPFWIAGDSESQAVGAEWIKQMRDYSPPSPKHMYLDLASADSVKANVVTVYQHLRSRSMPITNNASHYWPESALETLRLWANQGFRQLSTDPITLKEIIPKTPTPQPNLKARKDLRSLTPEELQEYREKLDDVLQVGQLGSKWQELGLLHAEWCLHYQEAFIFWHRAYLRYVEELIDFPIPYWNGFAVDTSEPSSPHAGIPPEFLEETYVHSNGEVRKNPLKYALALGGRNKSGTSEYVERYAVLVERHPYEDWKNKVLLFKLYHRQIANAFSKVNFSLHQNDGYPWANLPSFKDKQPDECYPESARQFFDGLFEQAHDNYHGWTGPDMADNSYTAFDPIFLSYHANMDRIVERYLRSSQLRQFSSNFPLRPFVDNASSLTYDDPREYRYTTLGDMAKPTQAMGYEYASPAAPDSLPITDMAEKSASIPSGGMAVAMSPNTLESPPRGVEIGLGQYTPQVVFVGVSCLQESYRIDVFVAGANSYEPDPEGNPEFIGQVTRLGMGKGRGEEAGIRNPQRCEKTPITRMLDAGNMAERLRQRPEIEHIVTEISTGRVLQIDEWKKMPGFEGELIWVKESN